MCDRFGVSALGIRAWAFLHPARALETVDQAASWSLSAYFCGVSLLNIHPPSIAQQKPKGTSVSILHSLSVLCSPFQRSVPPSIDPSASLNPDFFSVNSLSCWAVSAFLFSASTVLILVLDRKPPNHSVLLVCFSLSGIAVLGCLYS